MKERERLIELLCDILTKHNLPENIADELLANGVIVPPCKVGDTVYTNISVQGWYMRKKNRPYKAKIVFIGVNNVDNFMNVVFDNDNMLQFNFSQIGKTVFLTKEEAVQKLKGGAE